MRVQDKDVLMSMAPHTMCSYRSLNTMDPALRNKLYNMGDHVKVGHLRSVAKGMHRMKSCLVYFIGDRPVGWAALYVWEADPYESCSVWVYPRYRKKGIGSVLITEAHRRWSHRRPITYDAMRAVWDALNYAKRNKS